MSKTKIVMKKEFHVDSSISDEWIRYGLNPEPANRTEAEKHIRSAYLQAGLLVPQKFLWMESPFQGAIVTNILRNISIQCYVHAQEMSWSPLIDKVMSQVKDNKYFQIGEREYATGLLTSRLRFFDEAMENTKGTIKKAVRLISNEAATQVWNRVGGIVANQFSNDVRRELSKFDSPDYDLSQTLNNFIFGNQYEKNCYYDCFLRNLDLQADEVIDPIFLWKGARERSLAEVLGHCGMGTVKSILEANKHCGYWWPLLGIVIATEKHSSIHLDKWHRLHCEDGMAIQYPDGWGVYAWKGIRVSEELIMYPELLTVNKIDRQNNAEIRRMMLERFGWGRYLTESGAKPVHKDKFGILYRHKLANDEPLVMVKVTNKTAEPDGTYKDYFLRVPPEMETAKQAVAWTFSMDKEEYQPFQET